MLSQKVENILVAQIEKEAYSSNLYLSMASWAEVNGFEGTAQWFYAQAEEETDYLRLFSGRIGNSMLNSCCRTLWQRSCSGEEAIHG